VHTKINLLLRRLSDLFRPHGKEEQNQDERQKK
jgi:hypothetical protein